MQMNILPLHEVLHMLAWMEGTWITEEPGVGVYPTIKPFNYHEQINITSLGQPLFNYIAQSWHPESGTPMHRETGFIHVLPGNKVSLNLINNLGLATVEQGEIKDNTIDMKSTHVLITDASRPPALKETHRIFKRNGDHLEQVFYMSTSNTDMTEHLRAKYKKVA